MRDRLSEELQKQRFKLRNLIRRAILQRRMPFFQKLIKEDKAWALYVMVVQKYIANCQEKKLATNYARASDEQKKLLEQMDIEIATMENMIEIPARAIKAGLVSEHEQAENNLAEEVKTDVGKEI